MASVTRNPIDGVELSYDVSGGVPSSTRPAILLLHGSGLSKAIWRGFGYSKALRENYTVIAMDLRGHGRSQKPHGQNSYAMELFVADAVAVMDAAGIRRAHLGGYSAGSRIGFSMAETLPERLISLTTFGGTFRIRPGSVGELFFPEYDAALGSGGMEAFIVGWEKQTGRALDAQTRAAFAANDARALQAYFRRTEAQPAIAESVLATLETPSLLFAGSDDRERALDSQRAAELMPNARFIGLPGRDHARTLFPAQPILDSWLPFLAQTTLQSN